MQQGEFIEYQKFNQKLLWIGIVALMITPILLALFVKKGVLISSIIAIPVITLLLLLRLKTVINKEGISVKFFPIILADRHIKWEDIAEINVRKYKPITEYGGWGLRMTFNNGIAYTVKGNRGIQIIMKSGKKILIGTQKAEAAAAVIASYTSATE